MSALPASDPDAVRASPAVTVTVCSPSRYSPSSSPAACMASVIEREPPGPFAAWARRSAAGWTWIAVGDELGGHARGGERCSGRAGVAVVEAGACR